MKGSLCNVAGRGMPLARPTTVQGYGKLYAGLRSYQLFGNFLYLIIKKEPSEHYQHAEPNPVTNPMLRDSI